MRYPPTLSLERPALQVGNSADPGGAVRFDTGLRRVNEPFNSANLYI